MSVVTDDGVEEAQVDPAEMDSLLAGYNARGATTPPADVPDEQAEPVADEVPLGAPAAQQVDAPADEAAPAAQTLAEQLAALKQQVGVIASNTDPTTVRKLHGEIGDINRKLTQLTSVPAKPAPAPVDDELTAAFSNAEAAAKEYPELNGPLFDALKLVRERNSQQVKSMSAEEISTLIDERTRQAAQQATQEATVRTAQEALQEEHPDWVTIRDQPAFQAWFASRPEDYRNRMETTWNPAVVSRGLSEFKASQVTQQKKQDRLKSAITPNGVAKQTAAPSKLSPDEEIMLGYQKSGPRPLNKR